VIWLGLAVVWGVVALLWSVTFVRNRDATALVVAATSALAALACGIAWHRKR